MQEYSFTPIFVLQKDSGIRVLAIANCWISDVCHVCADLMASPRSNPDRNETEVFVHAAAMCNYLQPRKRRLPFATDGAREIALVVPGVHSRIDLLAARRH